MNINNFENFVPDYLLERGCDYYLEDLVVNLKEIEPLVYFCFVKGSLDYEIVIELDNDWDILYTNCDCPHEAPICKHLVAAIYTLRDVLNQKKDMVSLSKGESLKELLMKQDKDVLVDTFLKLVSDKQDIQESLFLRFNELNNYQAFKELLENIMDQLEEYYEPQQKHLDRLDNITIDIYQNIKKLLDKDKLIEALDLCFLILITLSKREELFDFDFFFEEYHNAEEWVKDIVQQSKESNQEKEVFEYLVSKMDSLKDIDLKDNILEILITYTKNKNYRPLVEELMKKENKNHHEHWVNQQIKVYELNNETEEINTLVNNNLNYSSIKEYAIRNYLELKEYNKVLEIAGDAESKEEINYNKDKWIRYQYLAYKGLGNTEKQKEILNKWFLNGHFDVIEDLKKLYAEKEWKQHIRFIIQKLEENNNYYMIRRLAKEEGIKDVLYKHCLLEPFNIMDDYTDLLPEYKDKMETIFLEYINDNEKSMSKRSHYRHLTNILKAYYSIYGLDKTQTIINCLMERYPKRPALKDELNKLIDKIN